MDRYAVPLGASMAATVAVGYDPCDEWAHVYPRPPQPGYGPTDHVWYRGWEVGYSLEHEYWGGEGWLAYRGGCDLDAPCVTGHSYQSCLDEIDEKEDD